jgi:hypothetical protein
MKREARAAREPRRRSLDDLLDDQDGAEHDQCERGDAFCPLGDFFSHPCAEPVADLSGDEGLCRDNDDELRASTTLRAGVAVRTSREPSE